MTGIVDRSALELAALIRTRGLSPVEVTRAFLDRIEAINPAINAFVTVTAELAQAQANEAERRVMAGEALGPLHGVPVSLKDLNPVAGVRTTYGSPAFADHVPSVSSEVTERILRAGAVLLGKTNTPEFGLNASTEGGLSGATRNPWDLTRTPGGSSGGAGAALAARLCPFAEGGDGGGSIRIPASACGVAGLKPTRGLVPLAPLAGDGWGGLATMGPMARTVADLALGLDVMAGPATGDPYPVPKASEPYGAALA